MAKHLCRLSDSKRNDLKVQAIIESIKSRKGKPARFFGEKLGMKSKQVTRLLSRIECMEREKKYNRYHYRVDLEAPEKLKVGDEEISINEIEGDGEEFILIKTKDEERKIRR